MTLCICKVDNDKIIIGTDSGVWHLDAYIVQDNEKKIFETENFIFTGTGHYTVLCSFSQFLQEQEPQDLHTMLDKFIELHDKKPAKDLLKEIDFYLVDKKTETAYKVNSFTIVAKLTPGTTDMMGSGFEIANTLDRLNYSVYDILKHVANDCTHVHGEPQITELKKGKR